MDSALDWQLWHLAQQGGAEAYLQLHQRHQQRVLKELQTRCHGLSQADSEDLEQEVWIAVWKALPRYHGRAAFSTWLIGVTKNVLHSWLRHQRSDARTLLRFQELSTVDFDGITENDPLNSLTAMDAISRLPAAENQVILLRYFQQCADREIAARLQVPLGTVKGRIRSGLAHLRDGFQRGAAEASGAR